jgi:hypothetical protein
MTAPPSWPPGDQATSRQGMPAAQPGSVPFRSLLGIVPFAPYGFTGASAPAGPMGLHVDPLAISQRFSIGKVSLGVEAARGDLQQRAESAGKKLRRSGYTVGPASPASVAGYAGLARVVSVKPKGKRPAGQPILQKYAIIGPCSVTLSVPLDAAAAEGSLGQITLSPAVAPVMTPVVQIPGADTYGVEEKVKITWGPVTFSALVSPRQITQSTEEFALASLANLRARLPDMAVDNWQPDAFFGGQPCVRDTFLHGVSNSRSVVRSEYWWAGVVNGRGIQLFAAATKSIISLDEARPLTNTVVLLPPG